MFKTNIIINILLLYFEYKCINIILKFIIFKIYIILNIY